MPSPFHFLPHFLDSADSLRPAFVLGAGRRGMSMVLGVPTVRRDHQSYLLDTLASLVGEMAPEESNDTLIVVMIAEVIHLPNRPALLRLTVHLSSLLGIPI